MPTDPSREKTLRSGEERAPHRSVLDRVIAASLRHRWVTLLCFLVALAAGWWAVTETRVDAIPDLSDTQVIVYTEVPGQGPRVVEDQVTYPITNKMLSVPGAMDVRGFSYFGVSFVYVLFEEGTDLYWARSRVLEYLSTLQNDLPEGVAPQLGPDATGVGWAYMYALNSDRHSLAELRSIQDWYLRYGLSSVQGVSEVASFGGFVRQFQVEVDPTRLRAYGISLGQVKQAIRDSNNDVGGRLLEIGEREVMIRGKGYVESVEDLELIALDVGPQGTPILLRDVAHVAIGPELRRGIAEWNGEGETVGGIVVVRDGADVMETIARAKDRLAELKSGLPEGVTVEVGYDRTKLISGAIHTLTKTLIEESIIVALVCMLFLFHVRSAFVAILSIPVSILLAFLVMKAQGLGANIMSLGGIAISIGVLVDAAVVMVENAHKHLEHEAGKEGREGGIVSGKKHSEIILRSAQEVGPTLFFTLLVITVSFLPVFTLEAQEGKLFRPLAFTKTWAMAASALVAVTVMPVLMYFFVRGKIHSEETHPVSRVLRALYRPVLRFSLRRRGVVLVVALLLILSIALPLSRLGSEFMPPLWEGDILYMPTTFPGVSITKAKEILQQTDKLIASFPEVESVLGKIGRAETATDPAPLSMIETTIQLKPQDQWREGMTKEKLIRELDRAVKFPGLTNSWTMPIRTRIDMLTTGIRTPVGIKLAGPDLSVLEVLAEDVEAAVRELPGTASAYAERVTGGLFLDIDVDRRAIARYGLTVGDVQDVVSSAIGGQNVSWVVDGRERYPINVRYPRELRDDVDALSEVLVDAPGGVEVPLGRLASIELVDGPPMIKSENAVPNAWVFVDLRDVDIGTWVKEAQEILDDAIEMPQGYSMTWSGQWESMERVKKKLTLVIPLTLFLIALILAFTTKSLVKTAMIFLVVPMSLVGAFWLVHWLDYDLSVAVWVGVIALAGLDAEMGVVMLLYLDLAFDRWRKEGRMTSLNHLAEAVEHGAVQRIRPKMMTVTTTFCALVPILWATGAGADVMRRIAAPMVGGIVTSFVGELVVFPALYFVWRARQMRKGTLPDLKDEPTSALAH